MSDKKVLVVGSGGREHALCWKLSASPNVQKVLSLPGSFGIEQLDKVQIVTDVNLKDIEDVANWCKNHVIDLVVVGPEEPLANGLADKLSDFGIRCFGPKRIGAQIESNKKWSKEFMIRHQIPTARYKSFTNATKAINFLQSANYDGFVVKASGLAAGKGVVVAKNINEAITAVEEMLESRKYGAASDVIVIEEKLNGEEISVLAFVDSHSVRIMLPAQDHKRLKDNDEGPNTGGMGAYCPCQLISESDLNFIKLNVLQRAVDGLRSERIPYCGVLYAGIMLTPNGPKVLEFNCRFGDPETQVLLPLLETDLYNIMVACCDNKLNTIQLDWKENLFAVGVVMASAGYPENSTKGCVITGLPNETDSLLFHSAIAIDSSGRYITNGGRVLTVVQLSTDLKSAAEKATKICENVSFSGPGSQFRRDIGKKAFKLLSLSYKDSGVDIDAGENLVRRIKPLAQGTCRKEVVGGIGGFGGLFSLNELSYRKPVLCEVTKGVGIKIKFAIEHGHYENIGYDLVAMCANDILESGAEPIAFLDYIACGKLQVPVAAEIIKGIAEACRESFCALLGGETAELPYIYAVNEYDVAGYCVGALEDGLDLPKFDKYEEGDLLIGLPSNGLHCAGVEIVLDIIHKLNINLNDTDSEVTANIALGQEILKPSTIYVKQLLPLLKKGSIKSVSHISSGLLNGIEKIIPEQYEVLINAENLAVTKLYGWIAAKGNLTDETLLNYFNCGIGLVFVVSKSNAEWKNIPGSVVIAELKHRSGNKAVVVKNFTKQIDKVAKEFYSLVLTERTKNIPLKHSSTINASEIYGTLNIKNRPEIFLSQAQKRLIRLPNAYKDPILVIGADGVGTKIKLAQQCHNNSTIGIDLVAMCANDILCNGAIPLSFLAYYACGEFSSTTAYSIASGVAEGCRQAESSLIDFVAAELPLLYRPTAYDLAGFSLGITDREDTLPMIMEIEEGDIIIGLPSNGVHSNGYSLIHKIMEITGVTPEMKTTFGKSLGDELLLPTNIYVDAVKPLLEKKLIKALAHITGGGLLENIPRVLPKNLCVQLDARKFNIPPIFAWIAESGNISPLEMLRTYNCGVGLILIIAPKFLLTVLNHLKISHKATEIGVVCKKQDSSHQVIVEHFEKRLQRVQMVIRSPKKRIAVLISGSGTNLQAIINATKDSVDYIGAEVVLVISNKPNVLGLTRAAEANIPSVVISHRDFPDRENFDEAVSQQLQANRVDVICLAGFMRILSQKFVKLWKGKILNIHPSLLPKYPGLGVQQQALDAGESESGCTVHFVDEGVDTGSIILQTKVPILPNDDVEELTKRIQKAEHYSYPTALKLVCTGVVSLDGLGNIIWNN